MRMLVSLLFARPRRIPFPGSSALHCSRLAAAVGAAGQKECAERAVPSPCNTPPSIPLNPLLPSLLTLSLPQCPSLLLFLTLSSFNLPHPLLSLSSPQSLSSSRFTSFSGPLSFTLSQPPPFPNSEAKRKKKYLNVVDRRRVDSGRSKREDGVR